MIVANIHRNSVSVARPYIAHMPGVGSTYHATEKAARAAASLRRDYRNMRASGPRPEIIVVRVTDFSNFSAEQIAVV